jgi:hypothetical protein
VLKPNLKICYKEAQMLKFVNQIIPSNRFKHLSYVKHEEEHRRFGSMKLPCKVLNAEEVIMNSSSFEEGILRI